MEGKNVFVKSEQPYWIFSVLRLPRSNFPILGSTTPGFLHLQSFDALNKTCSFARKRHGWIIDDGDRQMGKTRLNPDPPAMMAAEKHEREQK